MLENEVENIDSIDCERLFFEDMLNLFESNLENFNLSVEMLYFFSILTNYEDSGFKANLKASKKFLKIIKSMLEIYNTKENEENKKIISQCIAQLPIEDLQG